MEAIIDSGADITITSESFFRKVDAVAKLRKRDLKNPDKIPRNYDGRPFNLDGRMDLDITFEGKTTCTPVYIKISADEDLLLSEGVCLQLGIISYHPSIIARQKGKTFQKKSVTSASEESDATISTVRVNLIQSGC